MQAIIRKLIAFILSVFAFFGLVKHGNTPADAYTTTGKNVEFCFDANPSTGYVWTVKIDGDCVLLTGETYAANDETPGLAGGGGKQYYTFTGVHAGSATVTFTYARSWETTDADRTVTALLTVGEDNAVTVSEYREG